MTGQFSASYILYVARGPNTNETNAPARKIVDTETISRLKSGCSDQIKSEMELSVSDDLPNSSYSAATTHLYLRVNNGPRTEVAA